jgi:hypothetical protein
MKHLLLLAFTLIIQLLQAQTERYAVVIHEIMADPTPIIGLPNTEYFELRNTTQQPINLLRWKIDNGTTTATITTSYILEPDSLVLLCARTQMIGFTDIKNIIGLTSFPSINNEGDLITLKNAEGKTIHAIAFETSWYNSGIKANGGWSLEMIDALQPCAPNNWSASIHVKGGTPGQKNSITNKLKNTEAPLLFQCTALDATSLLLRFDVPLDSQSLSNISSYTLIDDDISVRNANALPPLFNETMLYLNAQLDSNRIYSIELKNIESCDRKNTSNFSIKTGLPKYPQKGDVMFNELLFDPEPGGADFIEIINTSNAIINAKQLKLSNQNSDGSINISTHAFENNFNLFPFEPVVFTTDTIYLMKKWTYTRKDQLLPMKSLPSMPDDDGHLFLLNYAGSIIDEVRYDKYMHYPLLRNKEGVSLEKINYNTPSLQTDNWHSASASANYATPTKLNSQYKNQEENKSWIQIDQNIIHPDNNGQHDYLQINYQFDEPGTLLSVYLFNQQGEKTVTILNNLLCGRNGQFNWNGLNNQNNYLGTGIYILVADAFHLNGKRKRYKKVIAIKRA